MIKLFGLTLVFGSECGTLSLYNLPQDIRKSSPKLVESFKLGTKKVFDCALVQGEDNDENFYVLLEGTIVLFKLS